MKYNLMLNISSLSHHLFLPRYIANKATTKSNIVGDLYQWKEEYSYYLPSLTDTGAPSLATNITLLKASEVDAIFEGNDDMFKTVSINSDSSYQM